MVIKEQVRINTVKGTSSSPAMDEMVRQQSSMTKNLVKIAASVGITALIWKGLEPILSPLLKLLSLIALVVFLPLLPYVKQIAEKLKGVVTNIREGQGEGDGLSSFIGGIGSFISDDFWLAAGVLIGGAILVSLAAPAGLAVAAGAIAAAVSVKLGLDIVDAPPETEIADIAENAGWVGLAAGLGTILLKGGVAKGLVFGTLAGAAALTIGLAGSAIKEDELPKAIGKAAGAGLGAGFLTTGIMMLLGGTTAAVAAPVAVPIGAIVFTAIAGYKIVKSLLPKDEFKFDISENTFDFNNIQSNIDGTEINWTSLANSMKNDAPILQSSINDTSTLIGGDSDSMYSNITVADQGWTDMGTNSSTVIGTIISNLALIPRKITTIHEIITKRKTVGFNSLF